jgi:hypothetical protein
MPQIRWEDSPVVRKPRPPETPRRRIGGICLTCGVYLAVILLAWWFFALANEPAQAPIPPR